MSCLFDGAKFGPSCLHSVKISYDRSSANRGNALWGPGLDDPDARDVELGIVGPRATWLNAAALRA